METPNDSLLRTDKDSEKYATLIAAKFVGAYVVYSRIVRRIAFMALGSDIMLTGFPITRLHGSSSRAVNTAREHGRHFGHPC